MIEDMEMDGESWRGFRNGVIVTAAVIDRSLPWLCL